jgi:exodeoxyribonuclease V gamma subunit
MAHAPRRGDRNRRDDDRYLFLEALLSAQQALHISFEGFSVQDNSPREPSVLVAELLDYLGQGFVLPGDEDLPADESARKLHHALMIRHPLMPYSSQYFKPEGGRLFSYAQDWLAALRPHSCQPFASTALPLPEEPEPSAGSGGIELAELLRFYRNPCQSFLNRRLKIRFSEEEEALSDEEPFELQGLENHAMKKQLLQVRLETQGRAQGAEGAENAEGSQGLNGSEGGNTNVPSEAEPIQRCLAHAQLAGQLPQAHFGTLVFEKLNAEMAELAQKVQPYQGEQVWVEVNLPLEEGRLLGRVLLEGGHHLVVKAGHFLGTDWLKAWIEHLVLALSDTPVASVLIDKNGTWSWPPYPPHEARDALNALLQDWHKGHTQPLPLFAKTAWKWLEERAKEKSTPLKAAEAAQKCFEGSGDPAYEHGGPPEGQEPHVRRCFAVWDEALQARLLELACKHLESPFRWRQSLEKKK